MLRSSELKLGEKPLGFFDAVQRLVALNRPFAIATVIAVRGSASAKPGSKALIDETGRNVWGWVGGGCAETYVAKHAVEAMTEGQPRIVEADLDDEIFGLGMPCGGVMDVYIEPQKPTQKIVLRESPDLGETPIHIARSMGFISRLESGAANPGTPLERSLYSIAAAIAHLRETSFGSLKKVRGIFPVVGGWDSAGLTEILIVGSSRITEELARLATIARWSVRVYGWNLDRSNYPATVELEESSAGFLNFSVKPGSAVVIASHHKGDAEFIRQALDAKANYVGLIASPKRSGLIFDLLKAQGLEDATLEKIFAPAGLEMNCDGPSEIALSTIAEIIGLKGESVKNAKAAHA
jgi:xanthine/CO dehydrogenase XdhC/CoxF family maturation factor